MTQQRSPRSGRGPGAGETLEEDALARDLETEDGDPDPMHGMEVGLPLSGENWASGQPLVTVDYFGFDAAQRAAMVDRLLEMEHALDDPGTGQPRILLFAGLREDGSYHLPDLVAILTVRDDHIRVETARAEVTERVRRTVESTLGAGARHLRRTTENPVENFLDG